MRLWIGTSGYSYKEWKGTFYPENLAEKAMLRFYAQHFTTVEINNSFYRMPSQSVLSRWSEEVPDQFAFVLKAPRRITHEKRLENVSDDLSFLLKTASSLGSKLGPLLFQLPPFSKRDLSRLRDFLNLLPRDRRVALEFRHASWFVDEVYETLRSKDAALCLADTDEGETPFVPTAPWGYLRLRRQGYEDSSLGEWAKRVQQQNWEETFVFFKHEEEGKGPKLAKRFIELSS